MWGGEGKKRFGCVKLYIAKNSLGQLVEVVRGESSQQVHEVDAQRWVSEERVRIVHLHHRLAIAHTIHPQVQFMCPKTATCCFFLKNTLFA